MKKIKYFIFITPYFTDLSLITLQKFTNYNCIFMLCKLIVYIKSTIYYHNS